MQLRTLIVDDELMARKSMERLVHKNEHLNLIGSCENGSDGIAFLNSHEVDLVLLDVEMPDMTGFMMLESLAFKPTVIMTTTKENYAFDAFQYQVFDYLKKPITTPTFSAAIEKLVYSKVENQPSKPQTSEIYFKVDQKLVRVNFEDICYIENVGDYVKVVTTKEALIVYTTMKSLVSKLPENTFIRVHRSYIIHINKIQDIEQNSIVMADKVIPISRAAKPDLLKRLNTL